MSFNELLTHFPIKDPVLAFLLVLSIILLSPIFMMRLKLPSIIGLILAGIVIGPHGLGLLELNSSTILFSTIGLLYIMFLAALELDLQSFKKNRNRSLLFGFLTFIIPFLLGITACYFILKFGWLASVLVSSMFSSHTLLSYPIASRLGLSRSETVTIAIGGTILTDTAVLLVLAVLSAVNAGDLSLVFWLKMLLSLSAFTFVVLWGYPRIGDWFFRNIEGEKSAHFIFVLTMVFLAAFLAELAGVEPIIGAFFSGLALNRLIPHTSALMNRIEFVGHALFIPYFLISVGMLVNLNVLFTGWTALIVAFVLITVAISGKWLAAALAGYLFKYSREQTQVLFGLTSAHAAATMAVIMVGYNLEIIDEHVLNGTIILILVTCLFASFITERAGRRLALQEAEAEIEQEDQGAIDLPILTAIKNPDTLESMLDLALMLKRRKSKTPIYALRVTKDNAEAQTEIIRSNRILEKATVHGAASESNIQVISRLDINPATGITRAAKETRSGYLLFGWRAKLSRSELILGSTLEQILLNTDQTLIVCNLKTPLNTVNSLMIVVPPNAELENGFSKWKQALANLASNLNASQVFYCDNDTREALLTKETPQVSLPRFQHFDDWEDFLILSRDLKPTDLLVIVNARHPALSHQPALDKVPRKLAKHFDNHNFLMIYPEQHALDILTVSV